jgi:hypothetical protein
MECTPKESWRVVSGAVFGTGAEEWGFEWRTGEGDWQCRQTAGRSTTHDRPSDAPATPEDGEL